MPPWPSRLHLGSPASSNSPSGTKGKGVRGSPHQIQGSEDHLHDPPLLGVPVLALTDPIVPSPPKQEPRHGRSYSNPFTSIFGNGKRTEMVVDAGMQGASVDTFDQLEVSPTSVVTRDHMTEGSWAPAQQGGKDFVAGTCATCGCSMKWPRQVDSYRCQICLMINDLKPSMNPWAETATPRKPSRIVSKKCPRLTLDKTRNLINDCLDSYLQSRLNLGRHSSAECKVEKRESLDRPNVSLSTPMRGKTNDSTFTDSTPFPSRALPPPPNEVSSPNRYDDTSGDLQPQVQNTSRLIFRSLENYIVACFTNIDCLNTSFSVYRSSQLRRAVSESTAIIASSPPTAKDHIALESASPELDAKTLLLGDFAENGTWWTGRSQFEQQQFLSNDCQAQWGSAERGVALKTPHINWAEVSEWYHAVVSMGHIWKNRLQQLQWGQSPPWRIVGSDILSEEMLSSVEYEIAEACAHVQRTLLKASENILRRPGRPLRTPEDCRFLLILLANPLLHTSESGLLVYTQQNESVDSTGKTENCTHQPAVIRSQQSLSSPQRSPSKRSGNPGKYSGILKRILGLLANLPSECHHYLVYWFSRFSETHLRQSVDLVGSFVTYRLSRQHGRKRSDNCDPHGGLIPSISGRGAGTPAHLHAAIGASGTRKSPEEKARKASYNEDWQIKAAARVMSLLFSANIATTSQLQDSGKTSSSPSSKISRTRAGLTARNGVRFRSQLLPTSAFYNTMLDHSDLVADFEAWESRRGQFSFCQYPMFLSILAKIRIMEHDVRRQMEIKAREAFFHSILNRKAVSQYLVLKVRRDCLVEDSLRSVSEVVGTGQEDVKKGLRIDFIGEEGLDSGGLRKEWFLLLVRDVFDPEHGLFVYDDESHYCYFNPNSFETSDQFFLIGVVLGLAIYNSTILDVALPPFAFRKLLASAPTYTGPATFSVRSIHTHTLDDLAEFRPSLAHGLKQMLDFDGNVEEVFCRDFVAEVDRYGQLDQVPLCSEGLNRPVTNSNRYEFVDLYVKYILDTSVARQYEPFKRGFFSVCEGNALSLFRPEEIELLVRGSAEPLDVTTLRTVAIYDGWGKGLETVDEPVIVWFWNSFSNASAKNQRKLLSFITASDRIPAMGAVCLTIKITCLGDDIGRFPIARTCFNMLGLYRYGTKEILEDKLWRAVDESEGFGMK